MSMPSYWFDPIMGGGGIGPIGGVPNQYPAWGAGQINASMGWNPNAAQFNPFANTPGGFGAQTAAYQQAAANSYGNINASTLYGGGGGGSVFETGAPAFNPYGGGANPGGFSPSPNYPGGGNQVDPFSGAITGYNAPRQYGWDANEGAPVPAQAAPFQRGMFNPQTYGWDHNEGAPASAAPAQPSFQDIWNNRGRVYQPPKVDSPYGPGGYPPMEPRTPQQQSGGFGMNLGGYQTDPFSGAIMAMGGGGYDMSAQSRAYQSPLQGFDWAQSYGTRGGANADMLRTAGGASSGYYNPQLDWLSRSTLGMNNQPVDYSHMFGMPNSGYLGSQGRLNQDPFGGYVNPRDLDAGGSFPGNYQPRFNAYGNAFNQ